MSRQTHLANYIPLILCLAAVTVALGCSKQRVEIRKPSSGELRSIKAGKRKLVLMRINPVPTKDPPNLMADSSFEFDLIDIAEKSKTWKPSSPTKQAYEKEI